MPEVVHPARGDVDEMGVRLRTSYCLCLGAKTDCQVESWAQWGSGIPRKTQEAVPLVFLLSMTVARCRSAARYHSRQ